MLKGIIFDMDGVLVDTEEYHYQAWKNTFSAVNIHLSVVAYNNQCRAQGRKNAILNLIPDASESLISELSLQKEDHYKKALIENGVSMFHDAKKLLNALSKTSLHLCIASSSKTAEFVIMQTEYSDMFNFIITGNHIKNNKPNPDIFNLARKKMNYSLDEVIVIEDSVSGIIASRRAGIDTLAINRNGSLDSILNSDISPMLKKMNLDSDEKNLVNNSKTLFIDNLVEAIGHIQSRLV